MSENSANLIYIAVATTVSFLAAMWDVRTRRIPNWLNASILLAGVGTHLYCQGISSASWALLAGLVGGSAFFIFFIAGGMGAGDVKLMGALGVVTGLHGLLPVMAMSAIVGGVLGVSLALLRGRLRQTISNVGLLMMHHRLYGLEPHPQINVENRETLRLPYALPMFFGCAITLASYLTTGQR